MEELNFRKKVDSVNGYNNNRGIITIEPKVYFKIMAIASAKESTIKEVASRLLEHAIKSLEVYEGRVY